MGFERASDGAMFYLLTDHLSTARDVVDSSGTVVATYEFAEYGQRIASSESGVSSQKTWVGGLSVQDEVADTGLMMMGHRFYDPSGPAGGTGRFLNRDPIGFRGSLNLFEYSGSRPTIAVDASGLQEGRTEPYSQWEFALGRELPPTPPVTSEELWTYFEVMGWTTLGLVTAAEGLPLAGYLLHRLGLPTIGNYFTAGGMGIGAFLFGTTTYYHGSICPQNLRATGFQHRPMPTSRPGGVGVFVSTDKLAAENAIGIQRINPATGIRLTPEELRQVELLRFQIPRNFDRLYPSTPYSGWGSSATSMTEIEAGPYGTHLLNNAMPPGP
jgi:RHS repeat-associated protein